MIYQLHFKENVATNYIINISQIKVSNSDSPSSSINVSPVSNQSYEGLFNFPKCVLRYSTYCHVFYLHVATINVDSPDLSLLELFCGDYTQQL
jgi:hypothetical protein